jgi:hypothetical protein
MLENGIDDSPFSHVAATNDPRESIGLQVAAKNEATPFDPEQP